MKTNIDKIVETLEKNFHIILDEYKTNTNSYIHFDYEIWFKSTGKLPPYFPLYVFWLSISGKYEWEHVNQDKFPKTFNILKPFNLSVFSFAKLGGNSHLGGDDLDELHVDSTPDNPIIRIHLPLIVPKGDIFLKVKDKKLKWKEGKCLVLNTSIPHTSWNFTGKDRINLVCIPI